VFVRSVTRPIFAILPAVWAAPSMTIGHLLFSVAITGYILISIQLGEHDLIQQFGDRYRRYRQQAAMLFPLPGRKFIDRTPAFNASCIQ
jgi:protein-S-isoprenylcysteine O-methyltransferase Ste14